MAELAKWFSLQLQVSADGFLWAVAQRPTDRLFLTPPRHPERWSTARIVFHLVTYERRLAFPSLRQWFGGPCPTVGSMEEDAAEEEAIWNSDQGHDIPSLLTAFAALRSEQIALLARIDEVTWEERRDTIWGSKLLRWILTKTYQHTLEHTDEVLRSVLWWDDMI